MKEGFEALSRGDIVAGRLAFAAQAERGNYYAQLLLARALYYGYYGMPVNKDRACELMYFTAKRGYAPAAADCLRRMHGLEQEDVDAFIACISESGNLYARGVLEIIAGVAEAEGLGHPRAILGEELVARAAYEGAPYVGEAELAAVEATWSDALQERAASLGFADAQFACCQYESAAAHGYTPALLWSPQIVHFVRGIMQALREEGNYIDGMGECGDVWEERWLAATSQERYTMGKWAERWTLPYPDPACLYYRAQREHHERLVRGYIAALKRVEPPLGRDVIRLMARVLWRLLDGV